MYAKGVLVSCQIFTYSIQCILYTSVADPDPANQEIIDPVPGGSGSK